MTPQCSHGSLILKLQQLKWSGITLAACNEENREATTGIRGTGRQAAGQGPAKCEGGEVPNEVGAAEEGAEATVVKLGDPTSASLEVHTSWFGPRLLAPTLPHASSSPQVRIWTWLQPLPCSVPPSFGQPRCPPRSESPGNQPGSRDVASWCLRSNLLTTDCPVGPRTPRPR